MKMNANKALHRTGIPLRSVVAGELGRWQGFGRACGRGTALGGVLRVAAACAEQGHEEETDEKGAHGSLVLMGLPKRTFA